MLNFTNMCSTTLRRRKARSVSISTTTQTRRQSMLPRKASQSTSARSTCQSSPRNPQGAPSRARTKRVGNLILSLQIPRLSSYPSLSLSTSQSLPLLLLPLPPHLRQRPPHRVTQYPSPQANHLNLLRLHPLLSPPHRLLLPLDRPRSLVQSRSSLRTNSRSNPKSGRLQPLLTHHRRPKANLPRPQGYSTLIHIPLLNRRDL